MDRFAPLQQFLDDIKCTHASQAPRLRSILFACLPEVTPLGAVRETLDDLQFYLPALQIAASAGQAEAVSLTLKMMHEAIERLDDACTAGETSLNSSTVIAEINRLKHRVG